MLVPMPGKCWNQCPFSLINFFFNFVTFSTEKYSNKQERGSFPLTWTLTFLDIQLLAVCGEDILIFHLICCFSSTNGSMHLSKLLEADSR